jgi:hypothetical protein
MLRWLKALPLASPLTLPLTLLLTLALAALSLFAASCGSNAPSLVRFVHAIQDEGTLNVDVNGTPKFIEISFLGVLPNQPGYITVPSGNDTVEGFLASNNTEAFISSVGWGAGSSYTMIETGFSQTGVNGSNVVPMSIPDIIPAPPSGYVEFRVIHASPSGPGTVDVYIDLNPSTGPELPITISGLAYTQASRYVAFAYNPNNDPIAPGFTVYVTPSGSMQPIITQQINPGAAGAARTLVLTDMKGVPTMNTTALELNDIN